MRIGRTFGGHIVKFAQKPLFDLGYTIDFYDINSGFPSEEKMASYQAVLSWYQGPEMKGAAKYAEWLRQQMEAGRKVLILGNYGAFSEDVPTAAGPATRYLLIDEYNRFFYPFGLEFRAAWTPDRADLDEGAASVVVATPHGGLALESYILKEAPGKLDPDFHVAEPLSFEALLKKRGPLLISPLQRGTAGWVVVLSKAHVAHKSLGLACGPQFGDVLNVEFSFSPPGWRIRRSKSANCEGVSSPISP